MTQYAKALSMIGKHGVETRLKINDRCTTVEVPVRLYDVTIDDGLGCTLPRLSFEGEVLDYIHTGARSGKTLYSQMHRRSIPNIKKVVFNDPATIVMWADGTKTVVKTQNDEIFDPEKGLAMAIAKKALGNEGNYFNEIKKWVDEYYDDLEIIRPISNDMAKNINDILSITCLGQHYTDGTEEK